MSQTPRELLARLLGAQQALSAHVAELLPPRELFPRVLETICTTFDWRMGAAWQLGDDGRLRLAASWHGEDSLGRALATELADRSLAPGEDVAGRAWARADLAWTDATGAGSALAVPLLLAGDFAGVLEFRSDEIDEPDRDLRAWLAASAAQIAQYLDRWETHERLLSRDRALAAAVNGVVISDATQPGFPLIYANPGFERLTGYRQEEVLGRSCAVLQGADSDPEAMEEFAAALRAGREARTTILNYRKDGTPFWNEVFLSPVHDEDGRVHQYVGVQNDVTDRRNAEDRVTFLAYHDALTGLANRALLAKHMERALDRARRHDLEVALLFLDLDDFKAVNDSLGHAAGDDLLREVAGRLRAVARASDLLVRQGGDEFLLLLADIDGDARARAISLAEQITLALRRPLSIGGTELRLRTSVGISVFPADAESPEALLKHADTAMYRAKRAGGSGYRVASTRRRATASLHAPGPAVSVDDAARASLAEILVQGGIHAVYQPIVELDSGRTVAFEALGRGPSGSPVESPAALFATARDTGRLGELDWACRGAAISGALERNLTSSHALFINIEPETLGLACPAHLEKLWERAGDELRVVVEITERALTARPAELLHAVEGMRARGWGIALDDVGADTRSLALMPLLRPDVIKLDLRLVQDQPSAEIAEIVNAVNAERERTGALVLAEGLETESHVRHALAMGATLGQGWHFARPAALPAALGEAGRGVPILPRPPAPEGTTPFEVLHGIREIRRGDKRLLLAISHHLEHQVASLGESAVILSAFQEAERFTKATHRRYTSLAADAAFVAALGVEMDPEPAPGVRGARLGPDDRLLGEWSVAVLGPHFAAALVAVDLGDEGADWDRRFDFALTYDRDLVIAAAQSLMERVLPLSTPAPLARAAA